MVSRLNLAMALVAATLDRDRNLSQQHHSELFHLPELLLRYPLKLQLLRHHPLLLPRPSHWSRQRR